MKKLVPFFIVLLALSCGKKDDGGCANPHAALVAGDPIQLSPDNKVCEGQTGCEAKDEDPYIILAQDQKFYFAWLSNRTDKNDDIYIRTSKDGMNWDEPVRVTTSTDADWYPTLVEYQTDTARFHLVWMRQEVAAPFARHIYYNNSTDGVTWDTSKEIAVTSGAVDDFLPHFFEKDGKFYIYFDNGIGRSTSGTRDIFVTKSEDKGATWSTPEEVTSLNSPTEHDSFPFIMRRPFTNSHMITFIRYDVSAGLGTTAYLHTTTDLFQASSDDALTWGLLSPVTNDAGDDVVDTIPTMFSLGTDIFFTWMKAVNNEPHIMEFPISAIANYPTGIIDITESNKVPGWSPHVTRTLKSTFYIRVWVSAEKKVFYQIFQR